MNEQMMMALRALDTAQEALEYMSSMSHMLNNKDDKYVDINSQIYRLKESIKSNYNNELH